LYFQNKNTIFKLVFCPPLSLTLLHFRTGGRDDAKNVRVDAACGKDKIPSESIKNDNMIVERI